MEVHGTFGSIRQYAPGLHSLCASHHWADSPGDQRKAETLNVLMIQKHWIITTALDGGLQSWIRSTGVAQLVNADIALAEKN